MNSIFCYNGELLKMDDKKKISEKISVKKQDNKEFQDVLFLTNIGDVCQQINNIQDIIMRGIYKEYIKDIVQTSTSISYQEFTDTILDARRI